MAVRIPKIEVLVVDVHLKNGKKFSAKDIPPKLFGECETVVSFWHDDQIVIYPMTEVEKVVMYELER